MAQIAGITVERTYEGTPTYVRINLRQHSDVIPFLERKGIDFSKKITATSIPQEYVTLEVFREEGLQMINELCDKYGID